MRRNSNSRSAFFGLRVLLTLGLCSVGVFLTMLSFAGTLPSAITNRAGPISGKAQPASAGRLATALPGQWTIVGSPSIPGNGVQNFLFGLNCVAANDCWTVGYVLPPSSMPTITLIEHYDGATWSIANSPNSAGGVSFLQGVTCVNASDCWAIGYYSNGNIFQTLIEHYDGTAWSIVSSPNTLDPRGNAWNNQLFAVTCNNASDCWAVGEAYLSPGPFVYVGTPIIEHYDGATWSLVTSPPITGAAANLYGVTCVSSNDCWAVGNTFTTLASQTLIEHYDGSAWLIANSANSPNEANYLYGVTCTSSNNCWAVGYDYTQSAQVYDTLIEHFDGSSWSIVSSPNASTHGNFFQAVTCAAADNCWAIGYYGSDAGPILTLTEHYDGTGWSVVNTPNPSNRLTSDLQAISCLDAGNCWAIGYSFDSNTVSQYTLIEHYTVPPVQLTAVVSRKVHGSAGTFDIDLPFTPALPGPPTPSGIECRSGGPSSDYTIVFTFLNPVRNCGSASTGSLTTGPSTKQCTVNLTGVPNAQYTTVTLTGAVDSTGAAGNVSGTIGVLAGDTNADKRVNVGDTNETKSKSGQTTDSSNFRNDVNLDGRINVGDTNFVKANSGNALP